MLEQVCMVVILEVLSGEENIAGIGSSYSFI